jgi:dipeptidyl aminopeptidase/acylaminoacyl peptidase
MGGYIVVLSATAESLSEVRLVGNIKVIEAEVSPPFLFWSPDNSKLLGFHEYKVISLFDDEETNLGAGGNGVSYNWWRWSPDSTSLLIPQSYNDNTHSVTIERSDGSLRTTLLTYTTAEAYINSPFADWSPDGSKVAVTNGTSLLLFDLRAQTRKVLSNDGTRYSDVRWSPNGSRILYIKDGNVWVYEL